jgi:SepF-like predicted cell division protein (DUF552 family)
MNITMAFESIKSMFKKSGNESDFVEIDLGKETKKAKILVKPFILKKFEDVNEVLNYLREGYTIAIVDIKPLKSKDIIEVKRAIAKLKKTADALEGSIAGFGDGIVIITPQFAEIAKAPVMSEKSENVNIRDDM